MDMAAIADHYRNQVAEWRRQRAAHARWARARTFEEAGELTAQFAEGTLRYHPNGHSDGPDEETAEIGPTLAAVNRAGCVTLQSQPGCDEDGWRQRAAVEMLVVDPGIRVRLRAGCERAGLIYNEARLRRWRRDYEASQPATEHRIDGQWRPCTGFGSTATKGNVGNALAHSAASEYAARHAWQVTVIDPEWGRNDRFTAALDAFSGRQAPEGEEAAVLPQSERAKGVEARTHGWDGKPLSEADKRFFALRDSGYRGPVDQDGNKANCLVCDQPDCTGRRGFQGECNGAKAKADPSTSTAAQSGGMGRANSGGTMSVDLELPTATATDVSTPETLAQALRETADNARRSAVDKDAQAESLRSQAAALQDKPDMSESAQGLLNEAARLAEVAEARRGMAAAYEDKAAQVDAQRTK